MSQAQYDRQAQRDNKGKYIANPCNLCGKGCPLVDYYSSELADEGLGVVLHKRCSDKLYKLPLDVARAMLILAESGF